MKCKVWDIKVDLDEVVENIARICQSDPFQSNNMSN